MSREQQQRGSWLPVKSEDDLNFIAGFPCSNFLCNGTLERGEHEEQQAIICSSCSDVFYRIDREP